MTTATRPVLARSGHMEVDLRRMVLGITEALRCLHSARRTDGVKGFTPYELLVRSACKDVGDYPDQKMVWEFLEQFCQHANPVNRFGDAAWSTLQFNITGMTGRGRRYLISSARVSWDYRLPGIGVGEMDWDFDVESGKVIVTWHGNGVSHPVLDCAIRGSAMEEPLA